MYTYYYYYIHTSIPESTSVKSTARAVLISLGETLEDNGRQNVKIGLEFWKQNSQYKDQIRLVQLCVADRFEKSIMPSSNSCVDVV